MALTCANHIAYILREDSWPAMNTDQSALGMAAESPGRMETSRRGREIGDVEGGTTETINLFRKIPVHTRTNILGLESIGVYSCTCTIHLSSIRQHQRMRMASMYSWCLMRMEAYNIVSTLVHLGSPEHIGYSSTDALVNKCLWCSCLVFCFAWNL